jgi:hypothetical protein
VALSTVLQKSKSHGRGRRRRHSGENLWIVAPDHQLLGARQTIVVSTNERFSGSPCCRGAAFGTSARVAAAWRGRAHARCSYRVGVSLSREVRSFRQEVRLQPRQRVFSNLADIPQHSEAFGVPSQLRLEEWYNVSVHRAFRKRIAPQIEAGLATCARCGEPIQAGDEWDPGHVDGTPTVSTCSAR